MKRTFFVTGTDTGIGKTYVAVKLLEAARDKGFSTLGLKPVAAGCEEQDGILVNEDAWQLMQASTVATPYEDINPLALREPMAPHIAAKREGYAPDAAELAQHCRRQAERAEFCVVEGAGGWAVPLNDHESLADMAVAIGAPVIMVVGVRLGCINHSLLTTEVIRQSGLKLAGWVANMIDEDMAVPAENIATLAATLDAPLLGTLAWNNGNGEHLDLERLT